MTIRRIVFITIGAWVVTVVLLLMTINSDHARIMGWVAVSLFAAWSLFMTIGLFIIHRDRRKQRLLGGSD